MTEITTRSWHIRLACGKVLHGAEVGSFAKVKHRKDIIDLWVETGAGEVHAERSRTKIPIGYDFYVHHIIDDFNEPKKYWKLITIYDDRKIIKKVKDNGFNTIDIEWLRKPMT